MKKQSEAKTNNIFTESIFDVKGKNYNTPRKIDWNRVFERFILFLMVFTTLYFGLHLFAFVVYKLAN